MGRSAHREVKHERDGSGRRGGPYRCATLTGVSLAGRLRAAVLGPRRPQVFLHVGAMKTGTTYLQHLMDDNRERLLDAGVLWPGDSWADQMLAAVDVMAATAGRPPRNPAALGMWDRVSAQMREHTGRASVFSMEFLSYADEEQAARVVESFPDHDVHVVLTVRDARYAVPAQWQTSCRMAGVVPLRRMVKAMAKPDDAPNPGRAARLLRRTQGLSRMLEVWVPLVGAERTHVVTVPPKGSDPTLLWTRFASVLEIDPATCEPPTSYVHTSLGHESTEFLRLLNIALGEDARSRGVRQVKRALVRHLLERAPEETPIRLHRRGVALSGRWNSRAREAIVASAVHVVGDLDDLWSGPPPPETASDLYEPSESDLLEVADTSRAFLQRYKALLLSGEAESDAGHDPEDDDEGEVGAADDPADEHDDDEHHDAARDHGASGGPTRSTPAEPAASAPRAQDLEAHDEALVASVRESARLVLECIDIINAQAESPV